MKNEAQKKFIEDLTGGGLVDSIFGYAYKRCFSEYEAQDLCQEIIAEILAALQNSGDISNINAYIWQIAHNTYINYINRQKRDNKILTPPVDINHSVNMEWDNDILEQIIDADDLSRIKREISALPEIYKNAMMMHYLDGLSVAEIAGSLGIPENRVKQRLFTARKKIKKEVLNMSGKQTKHSGESNETQVLNIINTLADVIEYRLDGTGEHSKHISLFVKILIEAMMKKGVYADEMKNWDADIVATASSIHDIGKIGISDIILLKPARLTQEEYEVMKRHTKLGEEILEKVISNSGSSSIFRHAKIFAASHHERWNGEGFPKGLKGTDIPLEARIIAVADVYDSLVYPRPYKEGVLTHEEAVNVIKDNSGTIFDPAIVAVFDDVKKAFADIAK